MMTHKDSVRSNGLAQTDAIDQDQAGQLLLAVRGVAGIWISLTVPGASTCQDVCLAAGMLMSRHCLCYEGRLVPFSALPFRTLLQPGRSALELRPSLRGGGLEAATGNGSDHAVGVDMVPVYEDRILLACKYLESEMESIRQWDAIARNSLCRMATGFLKKYQIEPPLTLEEAYSIIELFSDTYGPARRFTAIQGAAQAAGVGSTSFGDESDNKEWCGTTSPIAAHTRDVQCTAAHDTDDAFNREASRCSIGNRKRGMDSDSEASRAQSSTSGSLSAGADGDMAGCDCYNEGRCTLVQVEAQIALQVQPLVLSATWPDSSDLHVCEAENNVAAEDSNSNYSSDDMTDGEYGTNGESGCVLFEFTICESSSGSESDGVDGWDGDSSSSTAPGSNLSLNLALVSGPERHSEKTHPFRRLLSARQVRQFKKKPFLAWHRPAAWKLASVAGRLTDPERGGDVGTSLDEETNVMSGRTGCKSHSVDHQAKPAFEGASPKSLSNISASVVSDEVNPDSLAAEWGVSDEMKTGDDFPVLAGARQVTASRCSEVVVNVSSRTSRASGAYEGMLMQDVRAGLETTRVSFTCSCPADPSQYVEASDKDEYSLGPGKAEDSHSEDAFSEVTTETCVAGCHIPPVCVSIRASTSSAIRRRARLSTKPVNMYKTKSRAASDAVPFQLTADPAQGFMLPECDPVLAGHPSTAEENKVFDKDNPTPSSFKKTVSARQTQTTET